MNAKYEISISNGSKVMAKVKVFCHRVTDRTKTRCPRIPFLGHKKLFQNHGEVGIFIVSAKFIGPSDRTDKIVISPICTLSSRTGLSDIGSGTMYAPPDFRR